MSKFKQWIKKKPLEAFVIIGVAFSFVTLFPAVLANSQGGELGQILTFYLGRIGTYSPVLTGMYISRVINPLKQKVSVVRRLSVFLSVWLIAEIVLTMNLKLNAPSGVSLNTLVLLALPAAILPAVVFTSAIAGTDGVRQMLATLIRPRGHIIYYLVALFTFPVIHITGTGIMNYINGNPFYPQITQAADLGFTIFVTFFSVLLFSGGINEESGWRGFAQNRLQARYSPLVSNLILWFVLVIWHIPNDIIQYQNGGYLLVRIGLYPFIVILFGWVYNQTGGSILAPAIFHASMNAMNPLSGLFPINAAGNIILIVFAIGVVISNRMWQKLPEDHLAVYQDQVLVDSSQEHESLAG